MARVDRRDYEADARSHSSDYSTLRLQEVALGWAVHVELANPIEDQVARPHWHSGSVEDGHPVVEVQAETRYHLHDFLLVAAVET